MTRTAHTDAPDLDLSLVQVILLAAACAWPAVSCGGAPGTDPDAGEEADSADVAPEEEAWDPPPPATDWDRDIASMDLTVDLAALEAFATIGLVPSDSLAATFDVKGLDVLDVAGAGGPLLYSVEAGRLDVGLPAGTTEITVRYAFQARTDLTGLLGGGSTIIWPYHCGNLYPCHPEPADGLTFRLALENVPDGLAGVYPPEIAEDAPPYQIAWSVGAYEYRTMGTTDAGTEVGFWFLPGGETAGHVGSLYLVAAFDWYEKTYGPYLFGGKVGPVAVDWGGLQGGLEHHPYWHVSTGAMIDKTVQVHEAGHGWFGGGVRLRCWEDFVLSEGTVNYISARAVGVAGGPLAEVAVWDDYSSRLDTIIATGESIAWPDSCGEVDIIDDGLFAQVPYLKGALFYRAVADEVGADALDSALAAFYAAHAGEAAGMQDMLDTILAETGFDPAPLANAWLRSLGRP